jgi:hypothetical protein
MAGGQGRSSPDRLPRGERTSPLGGARQWGEQGEAAQAFGTFGLLTRVKNLSCRCFSNDLCEAKSSEYTSNEVAQRS